MGRIIISNPCARFSCVVHTLRIWSLQWRSSVRQGRGGDRGKLCCCFAEVSAENRAPPFPIRAQGAAIGHTLLRESTQYPRREFWVLSPSASRPGQPCCDLTMSPLAPACLLLLEALFWRVVEFWEEGPGGRNWGLGKTFEGSILPLCLLCLPASWLASCGLSSAPHSPSLKWPVPAVGYPLLHAPHSLKWPVPAVISSPPWTHPLHAPKLWDKNKSIPFHLHCSVRNFVIVTQSTWCQQWGQGADTRPGTQRRCRFVS